MEYVRLALAILWATVVIVVWPIVSVQCCAHCLARGHPNPWTFVLLGFTGSLALAGLVTVTVWSDFWGIIIGACALPIYALGWKAQLERVVATGLGTFEPR